MMRTMMRATAQLFKRINLNLFFEFFNDNQMTDNNEPINEPVNESINESQPTTKSGYKYNNDEEKHEAIKGQKRQWYHNNSDKQRLKSLLYYYRKQLQKQDLKEPVKTKYESKLNEINEKLNSI